jgi:hypothetical protein
MRNYPPNFLVSIVCVNSIYIILVNGKSSGQTGQCVLHEYSQVQRKWKAEHTTTIKLCLRTENCQALPEI